MVERYIAPIKKRKDCFGGDILAFAPWNQNALLINACAGSGYAAHKTKAEGIPEVSEWVRGDGIPTGIAERTRHWEIWAWRKVGPRGKRKEWIARVASRQPDGTWREYQILFKRGVILLGGAPMDGPPIDKSGVAR